jgi:hypothetical protein
LPASEPEQIARSDGKVERLDWLTAGTTPEESTRWSLARI